MYTAGDFLHIPPSGGLSTAVIIWTILTTTPAFAHQFWRRMKHMTSPCSDRDELKHFKSQPWVGYRISQGGLILASGTFALLVPYIVNLAESNFPVFGWITGIPLYIAFADLLYSAGLKRAIRLRTSYVASKTAYGDHLRQLMIRNLQGKRGSVDLPSQNAWPGNTIDSKQAIKQAFKVGVVFGGIGNEDDPMLRAFNDQLAYDQSNVSRFGQNFLIQAADTLNALGILGRYFTFQFIGEAILKGFGVDDFAASLTSNSVAGLLAWYRWGVERTVHQENIRGIPGFFSCDDPRGYNVGRKSITVISLANAGFFSLIFLVPGTGAVAAYDTIMKVIILGPSTALDVIEYKLSIKINKYFIFFSS